MADKFPISGEPIPEIDLTKMSHREWRSLFDPRQSAKDGDEIIAAVTGMTVEQIGDLNFYDFKALFKAVTDKAAQPLKNDTKN